MTINTNDVNRSLASKKIDNFKVEFFGLPENVSNILGRQIRSIDRPSVSFDSSPVGHKNVHLTTSGQLVFSQITMDIEDDASNMAAKALYSQMFRQAGHIVSEEWAVGDNTRFGIKIIAYGPHETVVEEMTLIGCEIVEVVPAQAIYSDSSNNYFTVTIQLDMVDYPFLQ